MSALTSILSLPMVITRLTPKIEIGLKSGIHTTDSAETNNWEGSLSFIKGVHQRKGGTSLVKKEKSYVPTNIIVMSIAYIAYVYV